MRAAADKNKRERNTGREKKQADGNPQQEHPQQISDAHNSCEISGSDSSVRIYDGLATPCLFRAIAAT